MFRKRLPQIILTICLVKLGVLQLCFADTKESFAVKGEHITQVFAAVCQENNFADFHQWALKTHLELKQFESPVFEIAKNEIKDSEMQFSVTINSDGRWQAKLRDQTFTGEDPCEVATKFLASRETKKITLWSYIIPEARADKLVNECTMTNWLLSALATASLTQGAFIDNLANQLSLSTTFNLSAAFRAMSVLGKATAQTNFEKLLNFQADVICSRNRVRLYGQDNYIVVKKGYSPYRLGFESKQTGKPLSKDEKKILAQGKIYDAIILLGQSCHHDGDADALKAQIQSERESLSMKIARITMLKREISSDVKIRVAKPIDLNEKNEK